MENMNKRKIIAVLSHAFVGWALCAAVMGIGMGVTTEDNALIIHAIAAPLIFGVISFIYFAKFHYTTPLQTAAMFLSSVVFADFLLVALLIQGSLDMFRSILGTWIPFFLIFISTYSVGLYFKKKRDSQGL